MKVKQVITRDGRGQDNFYTLGKNGVELIVEHAARGEGDKWYYDVQLENEVVRLFDFISVTYDWS